jgi:hypothetical protein
MKKFFQYQLKGDSINKYLIENILIFIKYLLIQDKTI